MNLPGRLARCAIPRSASIPRILPLLLLCTAVAANAADTFTFSNPSGRHAVGVKVVQLYDRSRLYKTSVDAFTGEPTTGERTRPIQAIVWYPAEHDGQRQTFRDYMDTIATEDEFARSRADVRRITESLINDYAGTRRDALLRAVSRPMLGVRDAHAKAGKFPVVIYAPSFSESAIENADLCEYLASQGYLVLSSPSLGEHSHTSTLTLEGAETQASDISYLIGYASSLSQADMTQVAVVGFSWGGLANVFATAKDARIKALVSLEGSLRSFPELVDGGKDAAKYVMPARVAVPLLYLGQRPSTVEALNRDEFNTRYSFMNEMKYSDVYIVSFMPMQHSNFSSYNLRLAQDEDFGDYSRDEVSLAYGWAALYVRNFLDAYLKNDAAGLAFVNRMPAANKAPAHMLMTDIRRKKNTLPLSREDFVAKLAADGFDKAIPLYEQFRTLGTMFKLEQNDIVGWAASLKQLNRPVQAREIYRLGTHLDPKSLGALFALAEMQSKTGQHNEAVETYRKILELDPDNVDAKKYLELKASAKRSSPLTG
jgi:dienelactone hydrolase